MATTRANKNIADFKSKLIGGGARPNLFEVELTTLPPNVVSDWDADIFSFMCKAATLPAQNIANIDVPFRGRIFKVAGDRTIDTWTVTVINDSNFIIRDAMEKWMNMINKVSDNAGVVDPTVYQQEAYVYQLGRAPISGPTNSPATSSDSIPILRSYHFHGIFPTNVSSIDLSYDSNNVIEEFSVEMQVQWWEAMDENNNVVIG